LGMTVGEPLRVVEGSQYGVPYENYGRGGAGGASVAPVEEGVLSVNMAVTVTFATE